MMASMYLNMTKARAAMAKSKLHTRPAPGPCGHRRRSVVASLIRKDFADADFAANPGVFAVSVMRDIAKLDLMAWHTIRDVSDAIDADSEEATVGAIAILVEGCLLECRRVPGQPFADWSIRFAKGTDMRRAAQKRHSLHGTYGEGVGG